MSAVTKVFSSPVSGDNVLYEDESDGHSHRRIHASSPGKIHIILDNFSVHQARSMQAWLAMYPKVKLYFLPCYVPQLNPIGKVRWHMKAYATANRLYGSMAALVDAINAVSRQLTPSMVQTLAA